MPPTEHARAMRRGVRRSHGERPETKKTPFTAHAVHGPPPGWGIVPGMQAIRRGTRALHGGGPTPRGGGRPRRRPLRHGTVPHGDGRFSISG